MSEDANTAKPKLLAGGNPQIPKGYGDAPVAAYLDALDGWKHTVCSTLDQMIVEVVPDVRKAVKWNTPLYGVEEGSWFLGYHCMTRYVKVSFFRGTSLDPEPPEASKQAEVRYLHIGEHDAPGTDGFDADLIDSWIRQASALPGEAM